MRSQRRNRCHHNQVDSGDFEEDDYIGKEIDWRHQFDFVDEEEVNDRGIAFTFEEEFSGGIGLSIAVSIALGITGRRFGRTVTSP